MAFLIILKVIILKLDCSIRSSSDFCLIMAKCFLRTGSIWPVNCEFDPQTKYFFALVSIFIFCYFVEFSVYIENFLDLTVWLGCKLSLFSSNTNSRYYRAPTIFDGAAFNQPLCTDLQLRYFRLTYFNIFLTILGKVFCVTYRLLC